MSGVGVNTHLNNVGGEMEFPLYRTLELAGSIFLLAVVGLLVVAYGLVALAAAWHKNQQATITGLLLTLLIGYPSAIALFAVHDGWQRPIILGYVVPIGALIAAYLATGRFGKHSSN